MQRHRVEGRHLIGADVLVRYNLSGVVGEQCKGKAGVCV